MFVINFELRKYLLCHNNVTNAIWDEVLDGLISALCILLCLYIEV